MAQPVVLTPAQQSVVDDEGPGLLFSGAPGAGKTAALRARYLRLLGHHPPSSVLVLLPTRAAADRFLESVLDVLAGGFDGLPVTTPWGFAHDMLVRAGEPVSLLTGAEQREEVARLLAADGPARWPSSAHLLGRRAFVDQLARAVLDLQGCFLADVEVLARAAAAGARGRWADLVAFAARYRSALGAVGAFDAAGLLVAATRLLDHPEAGPAETRRLAHVLVDDAQVCPPGAARLVGRLADAGVHVTLATDLDAAPEALSPWARLVDTPGPCLTERFRRPAPPALVTCAHPAVEAEAVAGELLAARSEGVAWADMAVLVGRRARGLAVSRALARHGIPAVSAPAPALDEPAVRGVVQMLRWVAGDSAALGGVLATPVAGLRPSEVRAVRRQAVEEGIPLEAHPRLAGLARLRHDLVGQAAQATPADLAFTVWQRSLAGLVGGGSGDDGTGDDGAGDDRALDALVGFLDGLARRAERHPRERLAGFLAHFDAGPVAPGAGDGWWAVSSSVPEADAVTVAPIGAAVGHQWHTVVIAGCVEGDLPDIRARPRLFDPAILAEGGVPSAAERRRRALADERRRFALACSRPTHRLVGVAAPEPGVLLSRFVEGWAPAAVRLPEAPGPAPVALAPTAGVAPVFPGGRLRLSASQLETYDDCPLRYSYEYVLGARSEAGVHAALGSLVHEVLAELCTPAAGNGPSSWTWERLVALAEERWRDDIARFRPQVEEARRDYFDMLSAWWEAEGSAGDLAPEVLGVEHRFEVEVGPHRLTGFIDRVDRADDGEGIRIVDYKTGKAEPSADAVVDNLQLAVYHLAATRDPELAALGSPTQLRLLYLRRMHAFEQPVTDDHEAATQARVLAAAERLLAEEFEPSVEANCRLCSFQRLCPLQPEGRTVSP